MPPKHSDASTCVRMRAEPAAWRSAGLCPSGGCTLLAGHVDSLWSALGPFEMSAKPLRVPNTEDGEMMTGFLSWWYTAAWSHCGEKDRKQNTTIGRRPWTALESKSPALNHSQQNNHECRRKKDQIMRYYLFFYHWSQSKCLPLSTHKFEMPAQILKSNISNTSRHLGAGAKHVGRKPKWMQKLKKKKKKREKQTFPRFLWTWLSRKKEKQEWWCFIFTLMIAQQKEIIPCKGHSYPVHLWWADNLGSF